MTHRKPSWLEHYLGPRVWGYLKRWHLVSYLPFFETLSQKIDSRFSILHMVGMVQRMIGRMWMVGMLMVILMEMMVVVSEKGETARLFALPANDDDDDDEDEDEDADGDIDGDGGG